MSRRTRTQTTSSSNQAVGKFKPIEVVIQDEGGSDAAKAGVYHFLRELEQGKYGDVADALAVHKRSAYLKALRDREFSVYISDGVAKQRPSRRLMQGDDH